MSSSADSPIRRPWLAVALLSVLALVCVGLGFWQLERAGQSREALRAAEAAAEAPPITRLEDTASDETLRHRRVELHGRYVPARQFLIDNIVHDGAAGYYVLTPFAVENGGPWIIVNRGWVRGDPSRERLPDVAVSPDPRRIAGRLDRLPAPGLRLADERAEADAEVPVSVVSFPTMTGLEQRLERELLEYQLLLDPSEADGFERDFPPPGLEPARHVGYAAQWWLFGSIAGGAAIVITARQMRRSRR